MASLQSTHNHESSTHINAHLPAGACNFRDLGRGTKTPVCGCKRFWLSVTTSNVEGGSQDNAWCFCGHHACFHNAVSQPTQRLAASSTISVVHAASRSQSVAPPGYVSAMPALTAGLGIRPDSRQSPSINTRVWDALNGFARAQEHGTHSGATSQLPSTAHSFSGDAADQRVMAPPMTIPTLVTRPEYAGSATEIATPSIAGTPDLTTFVPPSAQAQISPAHAAGRSPVPVKHSQDIMELLRAHSGRLDALESLSFSHVPVEEVQDKFEVLDGRMLDLEQWRGEVEDHLKAEDARAADLAQPSRKRRLLPAEAKSFASDESFDLTAAAHAEAAVLAAIATNAEIGPRIDMLETRVLDLERAALPFYNNPWHVQVVVLPWGRDLRGIWFPSTDATQQSIQTNTELDEWTGGLSQAKTSFRSASSDAWTTESIQAWADNTHDWLSPKACGPTGTVFQRLAGRGLIQEVTFSASDSRHILDVLATTFKHVLPVTQEAEDNDSKHYHGLRAAFIPLRKIRKSTRLRFLSQAEMITSATWTASFLESSVFMKVGDGRRRLYVTTPQAYIQNPATSINWQQIRRLPARDVHGVVQAGQIDTSVAIEACWSYNDKLDHIPSLHSSFISQAAWSTKSQKSTSNDDVGQLTPALSGSDAPHQRTMSLPSSTSAQEQLRETLSKRRVASFETTSVAPLVINTSEPSKRRRLSKSPEVERRGVNFTPRWSREPPSPFFSENTAELNASRKRGNTPFAYATPHSHTHLTTFFDLGDGDTERDTEPYQSGVEDEEEWKGMDAAQASSLEYTSVGSDNDNEFMDEEDYMP